MKKTLLTVLILFLSLISIHAQEQRINLYGGYVFDDGVDHYNDYNEYVNALVKGGLQYGAGIEFISPGEIGLELLYIGQTTEMPLTYNSWFTNGPRTGTYDLNLNYALASINKYSKAGNLEGYAGLMLGCLFSNASSVGATDSVGNSYSSFSSSSSHFTWGLKLGVNRWLSSRVAIKLQAQFLSTSEAVGGSDYYYGYYGYYYYEYINMFQWSFNTGLVFSLGGGQ